jgi:hypothetical protein
MILSLLTGEKMPKPTIIQVVKSVLAAFAGVQSEQNRQRDFSQGSLKSYIIVGIIFTVAFVISLIALVSTILG